MKSALKHLKKDPILKKIIDQVGEIDTISKSENLFVDILESIVSQQLSVKAANTIWKRFQNLFENKEITPTQLLKIEDQRLREAGISFAKIKYMKGIALATVQEQVVLPNLYNYSKEEVIESLTSLKGIGNWTAEMLLIFSLGHEDVFSIGDTGLRNAVSKHYGVDRDNLKKIEEITAAWAPYRSYASRYLWKSLDNEPNV